MADTPGTWQGLFHQSEDCVEGTRHSRREMVQRGSVALPSVIARPWDVAQVARNLE